MAEVRDFLLPDLGEGLTEGEIVAWRVAVGDVVAADQVVAEVQTEKAVVEVPSPFAGRVVTLHGAPGDVVPVGRPLVSIEVGAAATFATSAADESSGNVLVGYGTTTTAGTTRRRRAVPAAADSPPRGEAPADVSSNGAPPATVPVPSSPLVRRLAREHGIDLASLTGTGPGGVVSRRDLDAAIAARSSATSVVATGGAPAPAAGERIPLRGVRRVMAERLSAAHREIPAATAHLAVDASRLLAVRDALVARHPDAGVTPFAVLLRLVVTALQRRPILNARLDGDAIVLQPGVALGVAVQTDRGLLVPVIRDAGTRDVPAIAAELRRLATAARDSSIAAADLSGSTFTVSNYGAFGVDGGTPIINPPEVAILGVGRIAPRPWVVDGAVVARPAVDLDLVFDHRVCDGGDAGGFLRLLGDLVEEPGLAL